MIRTPQAVWLTGDSPAQVEREARQVTHRAAGKGELPVLVAYNIPFRDCAQYSAGGATSVAEYEAWIDALAAGIGDREAVVLLEPDGLGIIPWYTTINGAKEWCQPAEADPATAASDRFAMLNHAVDASAPTPAPASTSTARTAPGSASATSPTGSTGPGSSGPTASSSTSRTTAPPRTR